jgi:hypothetical protein
MKWCAASKRNWLIRATIVTAIFLAAGGRLGGSPPASESTKSTILLRDVTNQTGITFRHSDGGSGKYYIVEYMSAGLALFDYDSDGDIDIYFLNGAPMPGTHVDDVPRDALYRNEGNWKFTDVTDEAGVGDAGHGMGVAVGDYDNDGDPDIYLNNFGPNVLYRNNGYRCHAGRWCSERKSRRRWD